MLKCIKTSLFLALCLFLTADFPGTRAMAQEGEGAPEKWTQPALPETFTAFAVVMGAHATGFNTRILMKIDRWISPEEREHIRSSIIELGSGKNRRDLAKKQAQLLRSREECGFIRDTTVGRPFDRRFPSERLRYCWQWRAEGTGKRRIILALDRPIRFEEVVAGLRTLEYGITLAILDVDETGEGSGLLSLGTMVTFNHETERLTLENYSSEPIRLLNVEKVS